MLEELLIYIKLMKTSDTITKIIPALIECQKKIETVLGQKIHF